MRHSAVGRAIPGARAGISLAHNATLVAVSLGVSGAQGWIAPVLLRAGNSWGIALLAATVLATPFQWALIHESLHGLLWPPTRTNDAIGRVLCVLFGVPFHGLRFGHLAHHRFNRCPADRPEVYDPREESWGRAALRHYGHILGGMYVESVLAGQASLLPKAWVTALIRAKLPAADPDVGQMARMAEEQLAGRYLLAVRSDAVCILAFFGGTALMYGSAWPWALAGWAGRACFVSLSDNSYHYGTRLAERQYALNLGLPRWASGALLHVNLHRVHHAYPHLPWRRIMARTPDEARIDAGYLHGVLRQLRGPVPLARVTE